jgi:hypothetical protein
MVHSVLVRNLILADSCCKTSIAPLMMLLLMMMMVGVVVVDCFAYMSLAVVVVAAAVSLGQDFDTSKKPCLFHQAFPIKTMQSPLPFF